MIVNSSIVEEYLNGTSVEEIKQHWIFKSLVMDELLFEEPAKENSNKIKEVFEVMQNKLKNFTPVNLKIWEEFFGPFDKSLDDIKVYLIVGAPHPYDAMVRTDEDGCSCIILDIERIRAYSDNIEKLAEIMTNFITHELAHIYLGKKYEFPDLNDSLYDVLKHIFFDEGIAHFISFNIDVLSVNWQEKEMLERKEQSYSTFLHYIENKDQITKEILMKSNTGSYWDKFAAIAGMFAIIDYYNFNHKQVSCFKDLFTKGPDLLIDMIYKNKGLTKN